MLRLLLTLAAFLGGCVTTALSPAERGAIEKEVRETGTDRYLAVSFYVTPFFGDASKKLLTAVPPEEVLLLNQPTGAPVSPGKIEKILPVGTRVRILKIEFPTAWVLTERIPYTPRHLPWVYVQVLTEPPQGALPYIFPVQGETGSSSRILTEVDRWISKSDPTAGMTTWPDQLRNAVRAKETVPEMPAEALAMALGYPDRIRVHFEGRVRWEDWYYPGGKRVALVADGKFMEFQSPPPAEQPAPPPAPAPAPPQP